MQFHRCTWAAGWEPDKKKKKRRNLLDVLHLAQGFFVWMSFRSYSGRMPVDLGVQCRKTRPIRCEQADRQTVLFYRYEFPNVRTIRFNPTLLCLKQTKCQAKISPLSFWFFQLHHKSPLHQQIKRFKAAIRRNSPAQQTLDFLFQPSRGHSRRIAGQQQGWQALRQAGLQQPLYLKPSHPTSERTRVQQQMM